MHDMTILFWYRFDVDELWAITIKGSAFLWHQVRCMVAVLFMIGQGLESADVCIHNLIIFIKLFTCFTHDTNLIMQSISYLLLN